MIDFSLSSKHSEVLHVVVTNPKRASLRRPKIKTTLAQRLVFAEYGFAVIVWVGHTLEMTEAL